ncbi:DUF488 family protein [Thermosediminibacter litoriperuensis]|uniref:Uncharacterized protein DUF488 n=1 Tax=Thermosediminibacter litoriperuensis TaxID=291989 RepID=A0A5S5AEB8_9FIRM|nr:DUF488 domain-containing protein [Thermosediminibacter litoriperuensis]TYP47663.1 uncharacterized protein DUF488 [Thermosediminibacter litoriperuensis]
MKIFTIGFTKKSAKEFFELLKKNKISTLLDIRLKNNSQLAGFAKGEDLEYFTKEILGIDYIHDVRFSPTQELFDSYKKGNISWLDFEKEFKKLMQERDLLNVINNEYINKLDGICLLCSEEKADRCHRRLVAEYIKDNLKIGDIEIIHL